MSYTHTKISNTSLHSFEAKLFDQMIVQFLDRELAHKRGNTLKSKGRPWEVEYAQGPRSVSGTLQAGERLCHVRARSHGFSETLVASHLAKARAERVVTYLEHEGFQQLKACTSVRISVRPRREWLITFCAGGKAYDKATPVDIGQSSNVLLDDMDTSITLMSERATLYEMLPIATR
ncbi:hypothetical protein BS17DRAFT_767453 [Gyrodon lividus]|nr:hypothetical protein BS17DRAFT_767453 [Gyrodon lividus]